MRFFRPNPDFGEELMADDTLRDNMASQALRIAEPHIRAALPNQGKPIIPRKGHKHIEAEADSEAVYLINTDHLGHIVEFGSVKSPPYSSLRRGALAAGLRLDESE